MDCLYALKFRSRSAYRIVGEIQETEAADVIFMYILVQCCFVKLFTCVFNGCRTIMCKKSPVFGMH